jgi:hypothetical protein
VDEKTLNEARQIIADIRAAGQLLGRGLEGDYTGLDELPDLVCRLSDSLAGLLGLPSPVELSDEEQSLMQVYRGMPGDARTLLYRVGLSVRFGPKTEGDDESDILAFYRQLGQEGQRMAFDFMGILAGEWSIEGR